MLEGQRIAVVLPAYNAASILERTYRAHWRDENSAEGFGG